MRLFVGIPLPTELWPSIATVQVSLSKCGDIKMVASRNLHWTIKFLGDVSASQKEALKEALESIKPKLKAFAIELKGIGTFPSLSDPQTLWVSATNPEPLVTLIKVVDDNLSKFNVSQSDKDPIPHMTLGRVKGNIDKSCLERHVREWRDTVFGSMPVNSVALIKSTLTDKEPVYEVLHEVRFG